MSYTALGASALRITDIVGKAAAAINYKAAAIEAIIELFHTSSLALLLIYISLNISESF
jgi:hypothetical protein